ncbi:ribosomal protein S18 [Powellomyces hirtus]|nr:ribosomal protein S18 [Powellomyces hirtus]
MHFPSNNSKGNRISNCLPDTRPRRSHNILPASDQYRAKSEELLPWYHSSLVILLPLSAILTFGIHVESSREDENRRKVVMVPHARRRFVPGQTYSPNELNDKNVDHYLKKNSKTELVDVCDLERKNPLKEYKNVSFLSQFLTQMGYIRAKRETGLSRENQRRMTKAVKRAKAIGMLPFTYNLWNARSQGRR